MKTFSILTIAVLAVGLLFFTLTKNASTQPQPQQVADSSSQTWLEETNSEGGVWITVQPLDLTSATWTFRVALNTHSGSLDQDLMKAGELKDDKGNSYKPTGWDGSQPRGHHRRGVLKFRAPSSNPKLITLTIRDVAGIPARSFSWNLR